MFKVILWDLDNTLLDFNASEKRALSLAFEAYGLGECSDEIAQLYSEINLKLWKLLEKGIITKQQVKTGRYEELFKRLSITGVDPKEFTREYEKNLGETVIYLEESKPLLNTLKKDFKLYLVTNGTLAVQRKRLEKSGFNEIFDGAFISDEVGFEKPRKEFFDYVKKHIPPCNDDEIIIVGDSLTSDMQGGNNANIKCCWYNPEHAQNNFALRIDYEIESINQIYNIVKE